MNLELLEKKDIVDVLKKDFLEILGLDYINNYLENEIKTFNRKKFKELHIQNPFFEYIQYVNYAKEELKKEIINLEKIEEDLNTLKQLNPNLEEFFYEIDNLLKRNYDIYLVREKIIKKIEEETNKKIKEWLKDKKKEAISEFINNIYDWLSKINIIYKLFKDISLKDTILLNLYLSDVNKKNLEDFVNEINNNETINKIKLLFKRIKQIENAPIEIEKKDIIENFIPPISSNKELDIIKLDNNVKNMIPTELLMFAEEELSTLFDLKMLEKRLMCFDINNLSHVFESNENLTDIKEKKKHIIITIEAKKNNLVFIKFLSLYITNKSLLKNYKIDLIYMNENKEIKYLKLSKGFSINEFKNFISTIFYKETQTPFITIKESLTYKPDLIFYITDFIVEFTNNKIINDILEKKHSTTINNIIIKDKIKFIPDYKIFNNEINIKDNERLQKIKYFIDKFF